MTREHINITVTPSELRLARFAYYAVALASIDCLIPQPIPGVKPGLANVIVLFVLRRFGWRAAAWVSSLRVIVVSLVFGTFLSYGFFLSVAGAVFSMLSLALTQHLPSRYFSAISQSIFAAAFHFLGQLLLVYYWLIPSAGLWLWLPFFGIAALVTGTINGVVVNYLECFWAQIR